MTKLYLQSRLISVVNYNLFSLKIVGLLPETPCFVPTCPNLVLTCNSRLGQLKPAPAMCLRLFVPTVLAFFKAYMRSVRELFLSCFISCNNYFRCRLGQMTINGNKISVLQRVLG